MVLSFNPNRMICREWQGTACKEIELKEAITQYVGLPVAKPLNIVCGSTDDEMIIVCDLGIFVNDHGPGIGCGPVFVAPAAHRKGSYPGAFREQLQQLAVAVSKKVQ